MTSVTPPPVDGGVLAVRRSRRGWRFTAYAAGLVLVLGVAGWVTTHPSPLDTSGRTLRAEAPPDQPVYVGVYDTPAGFGRTLHVSGVRVFATSTSPVTIVPHVCHDGSVSVTTTPEAFCHGFGPTEGATLRGGDEIVLEVVGKTPAVVEIDRVRVAYRDGLQWATQDAGARAQVTVLPR